MKKHETIAAVLMILVLVVAIAAFAADDDDDAGVKERAVAWNDLPAAVQKTIEAEAGDHEILEIEEITTAAGAVSYDAEWRDGDQEVEINVAPDGRLLGREVEPWEEEEEED